MSPSDSPAAQDEEIGFWELKRGDVTLATLEQSCLDFPWVYCFIYPEPTFAPYRHLFCRAEGAWRGQEHALHELIHREDIHLCTQDGRRLPAFTLTVDSSEARLTFTEV